MKRLYFDTSVLVAALVHEPGTSIALHFLRANAEQVWFISPWVSSELASALALQGRRGVITTEERQHAWKRFEALREGRLQTVLLEPVDFDCAALLSLAEAPPLRAGDALHLSICLRLNLLLVSFDIGLCRAASHHQLPVEELRIPT